MHFMNCETVYKCYIFIFTFIDFYHPPVSYVRACRGSVALENSRKTSTSVLLTMPKPLTVWITTNCGKFLKRWEYQTTLPAS